MSLDMGKLLGLPTHIVKENDAAGFSVGETACGLEANRPPNGGIQGYDATHDLALTTDWDRVTCKACVANRLKFSGPPVVQDDIIDAWLECDSCGAQFPWTEDKCHRCVEPKHS